MRRGLVADGPGGRRRDGFGGQKLEVARWLGCLNTSVARSLTRLLSRSLDMLSSIAHVTVVLCNERLHWLGHCTVLRKCAPRSFWEIILELILALLKPLGCMRVCVRACVHA